MTLTRITMTKILSALLVSASALACGGSAGGDPEEGNAYLSIVGDRNVFLDYGAQVSLAVRYHDSNDEPLAGEVSVSVQGDLKDTRLDNTSGVTDAQGIVRYQLSAGTSDAAFGIEATAEFAAPTEWSLTVSEGAKPLPLNMEGTYQIDSTFDVASGLPGSVGDVVNTFAAIGDSPGGWLLDQIDVGFSIGFLAPLVDSVIKDNAPDLVNQILQVGSYMGQATRKFGMVSTLEVKRGGEPGSLTSIHTMTGFTFKLDDNVVEFTIDDLGGDEPVTKDVVVGIDANAAITVAQHDMPVAYGGFLAMVLEDEIVPLIDPSAYSLAELLRKSIDCVKVGVQMSNSLPFGSASFYQGACEVGVEVGADAIVSELRQIDERAPLILRVTGTGKAQDNDNDKTVDVITKGKWTGLLDYNGSEGSLTDDGNTFEASRMR